MQWTAKIRWNAIEEQRTEIIQIHNNKEIPTFANFTIRNDKLND